MEEFSDLEPYLPEDVQKMATSIVIDELNTPIFDRKGFDFTVYENTYVQPSTTTVTSTNTTTPTTADDPFKFEYELLRMDSVQTNKQSNDSITYSNDSNNHNNNHNNTIQDSEASLLFSTTTTTANEANQQENVYIINENETPMHVQIIDDNLNNSNTSNNHLNDDKYIINITKIKSETNISPSPSRSNLGIETPEDSNSCSDSVTSSYKILPNLKLNFNFINQTQTLNTPDVIDSVVDLERSFNILDYIDEKDVSTVNLQDIIQFETPTTSTIQNNRRSKIVEPPTTATNSHFRKRRLKRKKLDDDDDSDEDYLPPSSKRYKYTPTKRKIKCEEDEDEDEDESDSSSGDTGISSISNSTTKNNNGNNNRLKITKRTSSVCSDYSDVSKYRELRDKNNEASRRSRLKRKVKEMSLEKEADVLNERNVKLKAQVVELERMVNNFRSNLFKIMLKK